ncbi:MAG: flavin reductase family protein [Microbacterium sp.]
MSGIAGTRDRSVAPADLGDVAGRFPTGVVVVTTTADGSPSGMTASSFTYVSMRPPTVLVCVNRDNRVYREITRSRVYAVNVLGGSQGWIAQNFAVPGRSQAERFARVAHRPAQTGSPVLIDASGWLDCQVMDVVESGTHAVFVAEVLAAGYDVWNETPLVYYRRAMFPLEEER